MSVHSFEDLVVYKKARELRKEVYKLIKKLPREERFELVSQMKRAAISVTNNIAEGFGRFHYQENIQFCRHTRGSINELIDDLNICLDENYGEENNVRELKVRAYELIKMLNSYIAGIKRSKDNDPMTLMTQ